MRIEAGALRRWYAGEPVEGAAFQRGAAVTITDGGRAGSPATVLVLERLEPPTYLVALPTGEQVMVLEGALAPAAGG